MHASIRTYKGNPGLGRRLAQQRKDIEKTVQKAPGFISYYLVDTPDGAVSLTLCRNLEGVEESARLASTWLRQNLPEVTSRPPEVTTGEVVIELTGAHAPH
jgi:hypothetical protein